MKMNKHNFASLTPQDLQVDDVEAVNLDDPDEYLTPFFQTRLGIWVYRFRETRWRLYAIEMSGEEFSDATEVERCKIASYYGLGLSAEQLSASSEGYLQVEADYGNHRSSKLLFFYFDGLLYSTIHDAEGNFLNLSVCDVASERKDRLLAENVTSLDDILITKDGLDGVAFLEVLLLDKKTLNIIAETGVFRRM